MKHKLLYSALGLILLAFIAIILIPLFMGDKSYLFSQTTLTIIHTALSLAVAIVTFGVLADSQAIIKYNVATPFDIQLLGSAAGFAIFYFILQSGLNPYSYTSIYLYNEENEVIDDSRIQIGLLGRVSQYAETSSGTIFVPIPKEERTVRLVISGKDGKNWKISRIAPQGCISNQANRIVVGCSDEFDLHLKQKEICLGDIKIIHYDVEPVQTTLGEALSVLESIAQDHPDDVSVTFVRSQKLLLSNNLSDDFTIYRRAHSERDLCEHLGSIETAYNSSLPNGLVRTYHTCDTVYINLSTEPPPPTLHKECLK